MKTTIIAAATAALLAVSAGAVEARAYRNANQTYRGCAFREDNRVVIYWNDGATISYASAVFGRTTSDMNVY